VTQLPIKQTLVAAFERIQRTALIVGVVGLALCVFGLFFDVEQTLQSWLFGWLFWVGISLGCLGLLVIQFVARGAWGLALRRLLEAGALTLPLLAALFIPILFGIRYLYPWSRSYVVENDLLLQHKSAYLNIPFFIFRTAVYFALWSGIAWLLRRWSSRTNTEHNPVLTQQLSKLGIFGIVTLTFTITFAMIDWIMSLEPAWTSTIYALMVGAGGLLAAFALGIALLTRLPDESLRSMLTPVILNDLGNLLLAALLMWGYLAFSQYLVIWSGNLSDEIVWYLRRLDGGWQVVALAIVILHLAVPFVALLSPRIKSSPRALGIVGAFIFAMHLIDTFWLVMPALRQTGLTLNWTDVVAPIGVGGLWVAVFLSYLKRKPLLARELSVTQEATVNG